MAWITPVYNRVPGARMTAADMNRICGNIKHLYSAATVKTNWTDNDIVEVTHWKNILSGLEKARAALGYTTTIKPTNAQTYQNINNIERLTAQLKARADLFAKQKAAAIYAGDGIYTSATPENWIRG
ncbi:MAG: hypothetical protein K5707_04150 [Clostridia bacterium]|nr:hypothetical protein [Clostridia bacterium]